MRQWLEDELCQKIVDHFASIHLYDNLTFHNLALKYKQIYSKKLEGSSWKVLNCNGHWLTMGSLIKCVVVAAADDDADGWIRENGKSFEKAVFKNILGPALEQQHVLIFWQ